MKPTDRIAEIPATPPTHQPDTMLNGKQKRLFEALTDKHPLAASLYYSAIITLRQDDNPCRHVMVAHVIREMVNKLPEFMEVPQKEKPANIKVEVNKLKLAWDKCSASTQHQWDESVSDNERSFFRKAKEFFDWYATEHEIRYERNVAFVRSLDTSTNRLPTLLESFRAKEWQTYYHYFSGVAHLRESTELESWLEQLETFLLNSLVPRTFDDFKAIDDLLAAEHT